MLLGNYFQNINNNYKNFSFSGISFDTKSIKKNNIFFAIKGNSIDGNNFIYKAIKKGSKIIVTERKKNPKIAEEIEAAIRTKAGLISKKIEGNPAPKEKETEKIMTFNWLMLEELLLKKILKNF